MAITRQVEKLPVETYGASRDDVLSHGITLLFQSRRRTRAKSKNKEQVQCKHFQSEIDRLKSMQLFKSVTAALGSCKQASHGTGPPPTTLEARKAVALG